MASEQARAVFIASFAAENSLVVFESALTAPLVCYVHSDGNFVLVVPLTCDAKILKIVLDLELVLDAANLALEQKVHSWAFGESASQ